MPKASYDEVVNLLKRKNSTCDEVRGMLSDLGFNLRKGSSGNHYTYTHPKLTGFIVGSFDCGHGRHPVPLSVYFQKILKVLSTYEIDLRAIN